MKSKVKMTMRDYEDFKLFRRLCLAGLLFLGGIGCYQEISGSIKKYGSFKNFYNHHMEELNKINFRGIYP
ncbi:MAG: hypothetical protein AABW83_00875 [Nanoarchaeota archaeon]